MKNDNNRLIEQAEHILNRQILKEGAEELREYMPSIAKITMDMYMALMDEGFSDAQAFEFAKDYTIGVLFLSTNAE